MVTRIRQSARIRPGSRVRIKSNFSNRKVSIRAPRAMRIKVNKV